MRTLTTALTTLSAASTTEAEEYGSKEAGERSSLSLLPPLQDGGRERLDRGQDRIGQIESERERGREREGERERERERGREREGEKGESARERKRERGREGGREEERKEGEREGERREGTHPPLRLAAEEAWEESLCSNALPSPSSCPSSSLLLLLLLLLLLSLFCCRRCRLVDLCVSVTPAKCIAETATAADVPLNYIELEGAT